MNSFALRLLFTVAVIGATVFGGAAAQNQPPPEQYAVAFRCAPETRELSLRDADGETLAPIVPDRDGDAALGPLRPGSYQIFQNETTLGRFLLESNASILRADGRLWTDGELLHLENAPPASLTLRCEIERPGNYIISLLGEVERDALISIAEDTPEDPCGGYLRHVLFEGLPAGDYELLQEGKTVAVLTLTEAETALRELKIP